MKPLFVEVIIPLALPKNYTWKVPEQFQDLFITRGKKYRDSGVELFNKIYKPRMMIATEAVFLLFPSIKKFEVILEDTDTRNKVGSGMVKVFGVKR